jgi:hypothetical protein
MECGIIVNNIGLHYGYVKKIMRGRLAWPQINPRFLIFCPGFNTGGGFDRFFI